MSNFVSCFCKKCKSGGKPFDSVSSRTRQSHEKADGLAYEHRVEYYNKRGMPKEGTINNVKMYRFAICLMIFQNFQNIKKKIKLH